MDEEVLVVPLSVTLLIIISDYFMLFVGPILSCLDFDCTVQLFLTLLYVCLLLAFG